MKKFLAVICMLLAVTMLTLPAAGANDTGMPASDQAPQQSGQPLPDDTVQQDQPSQPDQSGQPQPPPDTLEPHAENSSYIPVPEEVEASIDYLDCLKRLGLMEDEGKDAALNKRNAIIRFQSSCNMTVTAKWDDNCLDVLKKILNSSDFTYPDVVRKPPTSAFWLAVNKTKRILTLYRKDTVLAKYPIAVGNPSSLTPSGKYTIVNKTVNPVWGGGGYSKAVMGGSPDNPLGYRWMGLSYKDGNELGIHGNNSPYSIGKYISHGCIRMINADAEELYSRIPLSIIVWIGSDKELQSSGVFQYRYE